MFLVEVVEVVLEEDPGVLGWFFWGEGGLVESESAVADFEWWLGDACEWDGELVGGVVGVCGFVCWSCGHDYELEVLLFCRAVPVGDFVVS